ncbi:MAG: hypothetical protein JW982_14040 [Spirochaetes bacterium]|nr:hypothetical protein [Spirochaetota bacterium]
MKLLKLLAVTAILAVSTSAFAQMYDLPIMFGIQGGWYHNALNAEYNQDVPFLGDKGDPYSTKTNFYEIDAFFDASFLRVSIGYAGNIGDTSYEMGSESGDVEITKKTLEFSAFFKYPLAMGYENATFYPMIGINYSNILTLEDEDGEDMSDDVDLNDFYLMLGVGGDFAVSEKVFIVPSVLFGINLTPDAYDSDAIDSTFSYKFGINVAVGFKL